MSLRQDIVVVNEFSVPLPGGKGSRGATPGDYVARYMAREQAVESLAPIRRLRTDDFIVRYMARESAVQRAGTTRTEAKAEMRQAQRDGGVAFGYGSVSLSDEQLQAASKDIQRGFDNGKTVLKTVLSFDEAYLKKHGVVDEDFQCANRGDYRGHIDQMKLRMAIMHGLDRMSAGTSGFDDFRYVAVIQVDTEHVHCHLAGYDAGPGHLTKDGTQRGKLLDRHKSRLRRGIDAWLDQKQKVAHLSSAVGYERRNVTTFIKRWAHERILSESLPQFLLACLPQDRSLWRARSNDRRMRKANRLVTELVEEQLGRAGSPLPEAMEKIVDYANQRREAEALTAQSWQRIVDRGRSQIIERAVNGVYGLLRALPAEELTVRTPMLDVMSMDYQHMTVLTAERRDSRTDAEGDLVSFGFRLRSYASRLQHHKERAEVYRDLARQWERAEKAHVAEKDSRPLYDFYRFEADYHQQVMSKYQYFLPFMGDASQWYEHQQEVATYGQRLLSLMALRKDTSLQRMTDANRAEQLGRDVYGQPGGRHLTEGKPGRAVLDTRIATMQRVYDERLNALRLDLASAGLVLELTTSDHLNGSGAAVVDTSTGNQPGTAENKPAAMLRIVPGLAHRFEDVKALDLHHLGYDFVTDVAIGPRARTIFMRAAGRRRRLLLAAMDYLDQSGQAAAIADLPVDDVAAMTDLARDLATPDKNGDTPLVLRSRIAHLRAQQGQVKWLRRSKTSPLGTDLAVRVQGRVNDTVSGIDVVQDLESESIVTQVETQHQ